MTRLSRKAEAAPLQGAASAKLIGLARRSVQSKMANGSGFVKRNELPTGSMSASRYRY